MAQKIWQKYVFAKLDENNEVEYFIPQNNALVYYTINNKGKKVKHTVFNPTEGQMNLAGWYRLVNVFEDGEDYILDNVLYHYVGAIPEEDEELGENGEPIDEGGNGNV